MLVMVSKACPVGYEASVWSIFFSLNDVAGTISSTIVSEGVNSNRVIIRNDNSVNL